MRMVVHGMIHLDGLFCRLVACNGRIYHAKNHGDVRKNQECSQQRNADDAEKRNCTQNCADCAQSRDSEAPIEKYRYVEDKKLYGDNDLVDEMHLARHCIGLSGIRFADDDIEKLAERIRKMKKNDTQICCSIGFLTEKTGVDS